MRGRITLTCGNDQIYNMFCLEFLRQYRRAVVGEPDMEVKSRTGKVIKKSKFDPVLVAGIKAGKIQMSTEDGEKKGGSIIFDMEGMPEEIKEWTKVRLLDRIVLAGLSKTGMLKLRVETFK